MPQHSEIAFPDIAYDRTDYTALRAYCSGVDVRIIADRYYSDDSPELEQGLERFLKRMRNHLVDRALESHPAHADILRNAREKRQITSSQLDFLIKAADVPRPVPALVHRISQWFRPAMTTLLSAEGIHTIGDLVTRIEQRGAGWWRALPRIGPGRARTIVAWLRRWPAQLGEIELERLRETPQPDLAMRPVLDPRSPAAIAPLGTFQLPPYLTGVDGINRAPAFCFIAASNDLEAIDTYLARYDDKPETWRSYRKELERLLLWCALVVRKPLSSLLAEDCAAYKTFLAAPDPRFRGLKAPRTSERWRPFAMTPMSAPSQRLAVVILRSAFDWLVKVRYLGGNPWTTVKDPVVTKRRHLMQIERALSRDTYDSVVEILQGRGEVSQNRQDRVALAAILLMGDSGLRRAEVVSALRASFAPSPYAPEVWTLLVVGKGNVERTVPVNARTEAALRAHWLDRDMDFDHPAKLGYLLAPLTTPGARAAGKQRTRANRAAAHGADVAMADLEQGDSYHVNSLYYVVDQALVRVRDDASALSMDDLTPFSQDALAQLQRTSPHAFRHTFATNAVEDGMSMEVAQDILGHVNIETTKIYARTREKRLVEEAAKHFSRNAAATAKRRERM